VTEFALVVGYLALVYLLWRLWARPRLLVLREEAIGLRYRVPRRLVALYVLGVLVAPVTWLALLGGWVLAQSRALTHSWQQWRQKTL
jgi:hypothetical protein